MNVHLNQLRLDNASTIIVESHVPKLYMALPANITPNKINVHFNGTKNNPLMILKIITITDSLRSGYLFRIFNLEYLRNNTI